MLARTETPRPGDRNKSDHEAADGGGRRWCVETGGGGVRFWRRGGRTLGARVRLDTASRGPTTIVTPKSQFRTCPTDHGKAPRNIAP
ncbi:hypothetical protein F511_25049 [Dorcoceras hygrometricum]|uniref:Uncharacterized protein n=1 Tax=Dorcoceras hygrometricum TaxID=472368 RepID=A0A2Z7BBW0_9LAMI|nr:hypothetical protein F511_25049 [Dorcoceras hygrometricum]